MLVPQVDDDGNERAGIRLPEIAVPLATYTGWNFRNPSVGGTKELVPLMGTSVAFRKTKIEREAARDPRRSVEERYTSRDAYLTQVREAAERLVKGGYLLADDTRQLMDRAEQEWGASVATQ